MPIASGQLDQRIVVRVPNPLADPSRDSRGNLIPSTGKPLHLDVKRWAQIRTYELDSENTAVSRIQSGNLVFVVRRDSFTRGLEVGDKVQYDDDWYSIQDRSQDLFNDTVELSVIPSDDKVRIDFTLSLDSILTENQQEICTEDGQLLIPEDNV